MKTKTKTLAVVEIAIVLCSVFLVALPAIAADQNTQKTITTASEDDFTLGIYGNANEDDTIDMRDTTYIKLAIFGKKPETDLADANNDGKVSMLDVGQTKLIILGKEKSLTVIDSIEDVVTVHKPVKSIVVARDSYAEGLRALGVADRVVAVDEKIMGRRSYFPELTKLPSIGSHRSIDYEVILNLNPDLVYASFKKEQREKLPGIPVINLNPEFRDTVTKNMRTLGYILDSREKAEEYIEWYEDWMNMIAERTEGLSDDEKPQVLTGSLKLESNTYWTMGRGNPIHWQCEMAGGKNMGGELSPGWGSNPDIEWVITENPDILLVQAAYDPAEGGYDIDDPSKMRETWEQHINYIPFASTTAVKERKVYAYCASAFGYKNAGANLVGIAYFAKWFHPELFGDLNPEVIHREYLTKFQHLDYDLDEHGIFAYPPIEVDDGLAGIPDKYKGEI